MYGRNYQCCQLWKTFLASFAGKIWPLRKKSVPLAIFPLETKLSLSVQLEYYIIFLDLPRIREKKSKKTNFPKEKNLSLYKQMIKKREKIKTTREFFVVY